MANFQIIDLTGAKVGSIDLSDDVFAAPVKNREHLLWEVVTAQLASRRRGTHKVKSRTEVHRSRKKAYRQKGTGNARHGARNANTFVGGGSEHGPVPRDYTIEPPKKVRRAALKIAISLRAAEGNLVILRDAKLAGIKTKAAAAALGKIGAQKSLIVESGANEALVKSVRNIPHVKWIAPEGINVYDVLRHEKLVLTAETAKAIEARLGA